MKYLSFIGKMLGLIIFLIMINIFNDNQITIVKIFIIIYGVYKLINFVWIQKINKNLNI